MTTLGLMSIVPIMPLYLQQLVELTPGQAGVWTSLALAAPAIGAIVFATELGRACDHFGYRRLLLWSLSGFTLSMLLMALTTNIQGFLLGRLLLGISGVGVTVTAFASAASPSEQRGRTLGLMQSATACGSLLGPIIGGVLLDTWSVKPLLLATAMFTGVAIVACALLLLEPARLLTDENSKHRTSGQQSKLRFTAFGWLGALREPQVRLWLLAASASQAAAFALVNVFVLYLQSTFYSPSSATVSALNSADSLLNLSSATGLIHALGWLATMISSPLWGRANDRGSARVNFIVASIGCAVCMLVMTQLSELWSVAATRFIQGVFFGGLVQTVFYHLGKTCLSHQQGSSVGTGKSYLVLGQIVGPLLVMLLLPFLSSAALLIVVSLLFAGAALLVYLAGDEESMAGNTLSSA